MYQALIIIHVVIAAGIVGLVLLQQGRGADAGAAFGSGASGTVFGAHGAASFLTRTTAILATLFFISSLVLAYLSGAGNKRTDIMDGPEIEQISTDIPESIPESVTPGIELPDDLPVSQPLESGANDIENAVGAPIEDAIDDLPADLPNPN